ncbi:MAG: hypothetical protein M3P40_04905 [Actinomycetota bacterium]|nr:hypothetical protein [Actinomycetota bacterium]
MVRTLLFSLVFFALTAPVAYAAEGHDAGEGLVGETNDKIVTNYGFGLLAFFPLFILAMSILQWYLERKKDARKDAAKVRAARVEERAGW